MDMKPIIPKTLSQFKLDLEKLTPEQLDKKAIAYNHNYLGSWGKNRLEAIKHCRNKFREVAK